LSLTPAFKDALTIPQVKDLHGLALEANQDYLLLSVFDIEERFPPTSNTKNYLAIPYDENTSVEDVMSKVARWIKNSDAFNQYATHKEDWEQYALTVYDLPGREMSWTGVNSHLSDNPDFRLSLVGDVRLGDFLLPNGSSEQKSENIKSFDHFMRILDRDRVTHEIKQAIHLIIDESGKPLPGKVAYSGKDYENDIRAASHPDAHWVALHSAQPQPATM